MAATRIRLNTQQAADFASICNIGASRLSQALEALQAAEARVLHTADIQELLRPIVGADNVNALVRQAISIGIAVRREIFAEDTPLRIGEALERSTELAVHLQSWNELQTIFWQIVNDPHIKNTAKGFDLYHDYAHLLDSFRIISDVRPLFDDDGTALVAGMIRHVIRISYTSVAGGASISVAVDLDEIKSIAKACERAIQKDAVLSAFLDNPSKIEKLSPGEDRDDLE